MSLSSTTIKVTIGNDTIPCKDSICAEWEDQLEDYASKNFSELQIEIMKPKLIDAPYQHNCELAEEYSVLSNRTGCIRKSVKSVLLILLKLVLPGENRIIT